MKNRYVPKQRKITSEILRERSDAHYKKKSPTITSKRREINKSKQTSKRATKSTHYQNPHHHNHIQEQGQTIKINKTATKSTHNHNQKARQTIKSSKRGAKKSENPNSIVRFYLADIAFGHLRRIRERNSQVLARELVSRMDPLVACQTQRRLVRTAQDGRLRHLARIALDLHLPPLSLSKQNPP